MRDIYTRTRSSAFGLTMKYLLDTPWFPFFTATVVFILTYFALDIVAIYYMVFTIVLMLLLLDDLTPLIPHLAFVNVLASVENSPSSLANSSKYFMQPIIYGQIIALAAIVVAALVFRFVKIGANKSFKPNGVFWGLCALAATFILNGAGSANYTPLNFVYGALMAFAFLGVYTLYAGSIKLSEENFKKLALGFVAFSLLLVLELFVRYMQVMPQLRLFLSNRMSYDEFKALIYFGWGNWNTAGTLFTLCIPMIFMLAVKSKHGWALAAYATIVAICAALTWSRQAFIGIIITYPASAAILIIKGKNRPLNLATIGMVVLIIAVALLSRTDLIHMLIDGIKASIINIDGDYTGNGRMWLIRTALNFFSENPVFGGGFFVDFTSNGATDFAQIPLIPGMAHNTFAEMISVAGIFGITAYCVHRIQTFVAFVENPSMDKAFLALTVLALLGICMFDNHIFYIMPTLIYSGFLAFICMPNGQIA